MNRSPIYQYAKAPVQTDARLFSSVFERNSPPIIAALARYLSDRTGSVLEIGSGTGQHAAALQLAFPALDWQASDPSAEHRASTAAWFQHLRLPARAALDIDAATDWADLDAVQNLGPLQAVVSMNVLHIAPFAVTQSIIAQARTALSDDGMLLFYGPFAINGDMISDGNRAFDAQLRANDPNAGIRDTDDIAQIATQHHMRLDEIRPMPANNQLLILRA